MDFPRLRARAAAAALTALAGVTALALPAQADPQPAPADQGIPVAVAPVQSPGTPTRLGFEVSADAGATIRDAVVVTNMSGEGRTIQVYAADGLNTAEGRFDVKTKGDPSTDIGAWTKLNVATVTLAAHAAAAVPFTVTVPRNASAGDHVGGIVASVATDTPTESGGSLRINQRAGARIYLTVKGDLKPALDYHITGVNYHGSLNPFAGGKVDVTYSIRNTGNTIIVGRQDVKLGGLLQNGQASDPVPVLLPGYEVTLTTTASGVRPVGHVNVSTGFIAQRSPADQAQVLPTIIAERGIWAMSWLVLLTFLILLGLAGYGVYRLVMRRRTPAEAAEEEPEEESERERAEV